MNLYLISLGYKLGDYYVVGKDPTHAYKKLRAMLDKEDYAFPSDREMRNISFLANDSAYISDRKLIL